MWMHDFYPTEDSNAEEEKCVVVIRFRWLLKLDEIQLSFLARTIE